MNPKMSSFLSKGFFKKVSAFAAAGALSSSLIACSSGGEKASSDSADASMCSNIHVGTQDQVSTPQLAALLSESSRFSRKIFLRMENIKILLTMLSGRVILRTSDHQ